MKVLTLLFSLTSVAVGSAQTTKPTIVLVHGAFADGSSWAKVIPILENDGYHGDRGPESSHVAGR